MPTLTIPLTIPSVLYGMIPFEHLLLRGYWAGYSWGTGLNPKFKPRTLITQHRNPLFEALQGLRAHLPKQRAQRVLPWDRMLLRNLGFRLRGHGRGIICYIFLSYRHTANHAWMNARICTCTDYMAFRVWRYVN